MDQWISLLCSAYAAVGYRSARILLLCSANAAVGDALPSSHPNAEEFRCSAVRAPLWVARCHRRGGTPKTCVPRSAHAAVGCVLRLSHPSAAEFRLFAARAPLWAACCLRRIRMPKNFVALLCVRRCGLRIALLHPHVYRECLQVDFWSILILCPNWLGIGLW